MAKNKKRGGGDDGGGGGGGGNQQEHGVGDKNEDEVKDGGDKKPEEGGGGGGGGEKKKDGPSTVVLKVDMHCNGCTKKIRDSIRGFPGVEGVTMDVAGGKLTVLGKVDPAKLRDRVASKAHKTVEIVSPATKKPPENKAGGGEKPDGNNKPKELTAGTVVLKVRLHCHGCIQKIRKLILKVKGAEQVSIDEEKDLVTVKGTMDPKVLSEVIKKKMKRDSEVVQPKKGGGEQKAGGGGEQKSGGGGGGEQKSGGGGGGEQKSGGEKKGGGGGGGGGGNPPKPPEALPVNLSNVWTVNHGFGPGVYAPQMFSDENPNACSVM